MYNYFINSLMTRIYVWLSFDQNYVNILNESCTALNPLTYTLSSSDLQAGFTFDYGHN